MEKPVFALKDAGGSSIVLVDKDGKVLSGTGGTALPVVEISGGLPKEGQNVGTADLFALNLAGGVNQMYQVRESLLQDNTLLVELPGQIRVIFPIEGDVGVLLGSLRLIYSKIQSDGNPNGYTQIDLRFVNPVLR